ncbi:hypothetical protein [Nannocystis pusilla]|uniref:DUF3592 domain-containing protein n=1 Tax=Nannocystis pusilla TaxID=889268 RepID=A0ABS7TMJ7_9BACT|nr:hypothetical protein [Nannocystis pusilla]MBZ5709458.1 hypothetical protein [Nannocystis pusilla]
MNAPSSKPQTSSETAPNTTPGIRFAPTGSRWLQPRVRVHYEAIDPAAPATPFLVVRSATGGEPIVLAVTPPGEGLPPPPRRQRRLTPTAVFAVGLAMFTVSYIASGLTAAYVRRHCVEDSQATCIRRAGTLTIPVAGPFLVASRTRDPRDYALGVVQGAGLLLAAIGGIFALTEHHQRAVDERGIRLSRNTRLRPEGGPAGAQLTIDARF